MARLCLYGNSTQWTFLYSSLCINVTFITDQMGRFNCIVCVLAARAIQIMNCPNCRLPGVVVDAIGIAIDRARDMWITRKLLLEPSPIYTGTILNMTNVVMYVCVLEMCC